MTLRVKQHPVTIRGWAVPIGDGSAKKQNLAALLFLVFFDQPPHHLELFFYGERSKVSGVDRDDSMTVFASQSADCIRARSAVP